MASPSPNPQERQTGTLLMDNSRSVTISSSREHRRFDENTRVVVDVRQELLADALQPQELGVFLASGSSTWSILLLNSKMAKRRAPSPLILVSERTLYSVSSTTLGKQAYSRGYTLSMASGRGTAV